MWQGEPFRCVRNLFSLVSLILYHYLYFFVHYNIAWLSILRDGFSHYKLYSTIQNVFYELLKYFWLGNRSMKTNTTKWLYLFTSFFLQNVVRGPFQISVSEKNKAIKRKTWFRWIKHSYAIVLKLYHVTNKTVVEKTNYSFVPLVSFIHPIFSYSLS